MIDRPVNRVISELRGVVGGCGRVLLEKAQLISVPDTDTRCQRRLIRAALQRENKQSNTKHPAAEHGPPARRQICLWGLHVATAQADPSGSRVVFGCVFPIDYLAGRDETGGKGWESGSGRTCAVEVFSALAGCGQLDHRFEFLLTARLKFQPLKIEVPSPQPRLGSGRLCVKRIDFPTNENRTSPSRVCDRKGLQRWWWWWWRWSRGGKGSVVGQVWRGGPGQESDPAVEAYLSMPTAPEVVVVQGLDEKYLLVTQVVHSRCIVGSLEEYMPSFLWLQIDHRGLGCGDLAVQQRLGQGFTVRALYAASHMS
ncbi:unnamed protein product [Pleuronectes platessa]|uniref:Uncharacterized protein n=1 Tax=Pleuronectes platessa TaxID=8262 RepID=A0A9N7VPH6_PLEPL|nr:unnamed protein product [Pleuronectes platessa]